MTTKIADRINYKIIFLCLVLPACASKKKSDSFADLESAPRSAQLSLTDEKARSARWAPEIRKDFPASSEPELQKYTSSLGRSLVAANDIHEADYSFTVIDSAQVNSFSLPGGAVFITAPLLAEVGSEAELAFVLAHEMAHIKLQHGTRLLKTQMEAEILTAHKRPLKCMLKIKSEKLLCTD